MSSNETLATRLTISASKAKTIVDQMLSKSKLNIPLPSTTVKVPEGRPPRLGLGSKYIPHSLVSKYDQKIKRIMQDHNRINKNVVNKKETKKSQESSDDEYSKYNRFK